MSEPYLSEACVVLKRLPYKENDAHLVLFGPSLGKFLALAKGVRKPESKLSSLLDVGNFIEAALYEGKGGYTLTSATQLDGFRRRYASYAALLTSVALCELVDAMVAPGDVDEDVYHLLLKTLERMDDGNIADVRLAFFWEMLLLSGYASAEEADFAALLQAYWHRQAFTLEEQMIFDELSVFFCHAGTHPHLDALHLSKRGRRVMRAVIDSALKEHLGLSLKSKKILDEATAQFYS